MHDFKRSNKITGVHWLKEPIEEITICVKIKPQDGIISLPKFEEYANTNGLNAETFNKIDEYNFKWQEKAFSLWEMQRYSDVHNCITENELAYNEMLNNTDYEPAKVFTYIHDDCRLPLPLDITTKKSLLDLDSCFERLKLRDKIERVFVEETSSMGRLFRSEENLEVGDEQWMAMHVAFDSSDYNEDSQLVFKQEAILLSLYHNTTHNYLLVCPDGNHLELNPYTVDTEAGVPLGHHYSVSVRFDKEEENGEELLLLLNKLHKKWEKKQKHLVNFSMPPLGRKAYHLTLEIISAADFEMDDLYIEFNIKLPENIQCNAVLKGQTHASKVMRSEDLERWSFGHVAEFHLEADVTTDPPPLQVFFEVISTDWWGRHRTEGYSYLSLPLQPGSTDRRLSCSRPVETDRVEGESRRFFVGGCHLIKDLDVLATPQLQHANFTYTPTGTIHIRSHLVTQSPLPGRLPLAPAPRSSAALLRGAEAALRQYRRARARLAAATRDLDQNLDLNLDESLEDPD